ncbi:unnamed protein product [Arctogadus glacialis]
MRLNSETLRPVSKVKEMLQVGKQPSWYDVIMLLKPRLQNGGVLSEWVIGVGQHMCVVVGMVLWLCVFPHVSFPSTPLSSAPAFRVPRASPVLFRLTRHNCSAAGEIAADLAVSRDLTTPYLVGFVLLSLRARVAKNSSPSSLIAMRSVHDNLARLDLIAHSDNVDS